MYKELSEFFTDWQNETNHTLKVFKAITNESLTQQLPPYKRTIGKIAWHITESLAEMGRRSGLNIDAVIEGSPIPADVNEIVDSYQKAADQLLEEVKLKWDDSQLSDEIDLYGEMWKKGMILDVVIKHQIHHRAQLTVLMRFAGLTVPGVYGPAREEWQLMNMQAME